LHKFFFELLYYLNYFVLIYFVLINLVYSILLIFSLIAIRKYNLEYSLSFGTNLSDNLLKPFSILVPAYNEENVIVECVKSFLRLDYPEYEVVVCNDGSKDNTLNILIDAFNLVEVDFEISKRYPCKEIKKVYYSKTEKNLIVVDKVNGGKADALNAAGNCASYPYIAAVDADSLLSGDSLKKIMQLFSSNPNTVAVGGIIRVSNGCKIENGEVLNVVMPKNLLEQIQVVEYLRAYLFGRMGWSYLKSLLIISGAFGVFRQDLVQKVKGWNTKSIGEDMELVVDLHKYNIENKLNKKIEFAPDPVCWTQVPSDIKSLSNQRDRWQRGLMETIFKNISILFNYKFKRLGFIAMPYFLFFELLSCVIEMLAYPLLLISFYLNIVNVTFFWIFLTLALIWGLFLTYFTIFLEEISYSRYKSWKDFFKLFFAGFIENFGYRQIHSYWRFRGFIKYLLRFKPTWGEIKRGKINENVN
jgi:cellulose synthase/poly-beta-1,6-N-acetylglucosamine synthase-like glycosyltransferase